MKKIYFLFSVLFTCLISAQTKENPLVILNAKNIGYMDQAQNTLKLINKNDIFIYVYKGSGAEILQKFGSNSGVVIIATKKFILETFYKNIIEKSPLKEEIPSAEYLSEIGIFGSKAESKNLPYDELAKYINISTINEDVKKIASISFIKPADSKKMNPKWKFGALEITSTEEE